MTGTGDSVSPGKLWGCRRRSILGTGGQAPTCGVSEAGGMEAGSVPPWGHPPQVLAAAVS